MMKRKKYLLGAGLLCTILAASFCLSHITSVSAKRAFHALDGVEIVLDPGHGGKEVINITGGLDAHITI